MRQIGGIIDINDYEFVTKYFNKPLIGIPAPRKTRKINPQCSKFVLKQWKHGIECVYLFHVKPIYYYSVNCEWRPMTEISYHLGHHKVLLKENWINYIHPSFLVWWIKRMNLIKGKLEIPNFALQPAQMLFNVDFFPDPDPETTSVDGFVQRNAVNQTWADIRAGAGSTGGSGDTQAIFELYARTSGTTDQWTTLVRVITLFDTSSIVDSDTIDSATYAVYQGASGATDNFNFAVSMVTSTPASNTDLVDADYSQLGTTKQATDIDIGSFVADSYNTFTVNATGLTNISKTSVSKFGMTLDKDADNVIPGPWASATNGGWTGGADTLISADTAGTTKDPKLAVTSSATVVAGFSNNLLLMGVGL